MLFCSFFMFTIYLELLVSRAFIFIIFFPDNNLSPAQGTITKIGPEVQNTLVKIPIVFGVH